MDSLEFITKLSAAVAWPAATVVLGVLFRGEIRELLRTAKSIKGPGGFEFEREVASLQSAVAQLPVGGAEQAAPVSGGKGRGGSGGGVPGTPDRVKAASVTRGGTSRPDILIDQVLAVAETSPSAAVTLAWTHVDQALQDAVAATFPDQPELLRRGSSSLVQALRDEGVLDRAAAETLNRMRALRDTARSGGRVDPVSAADARGYAELARTIVEYLVSVTP